MVEPVPSNAFQYDDRDSALRVVEQQLAVVRKGDDADYPLLLDALTFLTQDFEISPSTREFAIRHGRRKGDERVRRLIEELGEEQVLLYETSSAFLEAVEGVCEGSILPRDLLRERGEAFLQAQMRYGEPRLGRAGSRLDESRPVL